MEINNIYEKYFIQYQHNINFAAFKTKKLKNVILLDTVCLKIINKKNMASQFY